MIKFKEDATSLKTRINIHSQYGQRDMVEWVTKLVNHKKKLEILELSSGSGEQTNKFSKFLKKKKLNIK